MREVKLTPAHERCLRDQVITSDQPGPVLRDFGMLLDFLGPQGVEAGGKYNLIHLKHIEELDRRLSRPLHLGLKRPLLKSHPYLQGLNLLLRASGLSRVEGLGAKARLVLDPVMMEQWDRLNPTGQYFNLMEAWLRFGRAEMVGGSGPSWKDMLLNSVLCWQSLAHEGRRFDARQPEAIYLSGIDREFYQLALMDLFGLVAVEHPPPPITSWSPVSVKRVPFGDAVFSLLAPELGDLMQLKPRAEEDEEEDEEGSMGALPRFGAWQPRFEPYFPEWRENLTFPYFESREGTFIFRVSLGKIWRLIAMPADASLGDLVGWILRSMKFDDDHLYEFTYRDRLGGTASASHPAMDEGPWADEVPIGTLPLELGQTMDFHYDFGDDWRFNVKLERVEPPDVKIKAPRILESEGKAPQQYPNWDE